MIEVVIFFLAFGILISKGVGVVASFLAGGVIAFVLSSILVVVWAAVSNKG